MKIIRAYETGENIPEEGIYLTSIKTPTVVLHYYVFYGVTSSDEDASEDL